MQHSSLVKIICFPESFPGCEEGEYALFSSHSQSLGQSLAYIKHSMAAQIHECKRWRKPPGRRGFLPWIWLPWEGKDLTAHHLQSSSSPRSALPPSLEA